MGDNPVFWLSIVTIVAVLAFGGWTYVSTRRQQTHHGEPPSGPGSHNDPLR